jgi:hypothetical protein
MPVLPERVIIVFARHTNNLKQNIIIAKIYAAGLLRDG